MKPNSLFSPLDRRKYVTLSQISEATEIPITTLRDWVNKGELPAFRPKVGKGRKFRLSRAAAEQWWVEFQTASSARRG